MVTPIPLPEALKDRGQWGEGVRRCVGMAVYCETAMKVGIWEPDRLDYALRKRGDGVQPTNGTLRALRNGRGSSWVKLAAIDRSWPGINAVFWGNHPIFHMLACNEHDPKFGAVMTYALNSVWGTVKERFWPRFETGPEPGSANPELEIYQDRQVIAEALEDFYGLDDVHAHHDRFVLSLACYFLAKRAGDPLLASKAALKTEIHFSATALGQPQLLVAWRTLERIVASRVWIREGIQYRQRPVLAERSSVEGAHVRQLFLPQVLDLAEEDEALAHDWAE